MNIIRQWLRGWLALYSFGRKRIMNMKSLVKAEAALFSVILELEYAQANTEDMVKECAEELKSWKNRKTVYERKLKKAKEQYKEVTGREYRKPR